MLRGDGNYMAQIMVGDMVVSLCGHDKGDYFIVIGTDGDRVVICDGKRRKNNKKKTKKNKHVSPTGLSSKIINNLPPFAVDANVRREIKRLRELL